jgi:hypothetical protein
MAKSDQAKLREQRLAAKLRENLRRRKAGLRPNDGGQAASAARPKEQH